MIILTDIEIRVLGVLLEKEKTTPDNYPLSLNSCMNACNQKSSRNPVMVLDDKTVARTLIALQYKHLLWEKTSGDSRVPKYAHNIKTIADFSDAQIAVLSLLFLRGPQTLGELRTRSNRIFEFNTTEEVKNTLDELESFEEGAFILKLPRQAGRKDSRYTHLLAGEVEINEEETLQSPAVIQVQTENERISNLEKDIEELKLKLSQILEEFTKFKEQFD